MNEITETSRHIQDLYDSIKKHLLMLCVSKNDSMYHYVNDFPFFCLHMVFKMSLLQNLVLSAFEKGECEGVKKKIIEDCKKYTLNNFFRRQGDIKSQYSIRGLAAYFNLLEDEILKTSYAPLLVALHYTSDADNTESIYYGGTLEWVKYEYEKVEQNFREQNYEEVEVNGVSVRKGLDSATSSWVEFETKDKKGSSIYCLNSLVITLWLIRGGVLPKEVIPEENWNLEKEEAKRDKKAMSSNLEMESVFYFDRLYFVLTNDLFKLDEKIIEVVLQDVFFALLKLGYTMTISQEMQKRSMKEPVSYNELAEYLGVFAPSLRERANNPYIQKVSDLYEVSQVAKRLGLSIESLFGTEQVPNVYTNLVYVEVEKTKAKNGVYTILGVDEPNFDEQQLKNEHIEKPNSFYDFMESEYGLTKDTLRVFKAFKDYVMSYKVDLQSWLNEGIQDIFGAMTLYLPRIASTHECFIDITEEDQRNLQQLYYDAFELKDDMKEEEKEYKKHKFKSHEKLEISYVDEEWVEAKRGKYEVSIQNDRGKLKSESYKIGDISIKWLGLNDNAYNTGKYCTYLIQEGLNSNQMWVPMSTFETDEEYQEMYEGKQDTPFFRADLKAERSCFLGQDEMDFITPLINYLKSTGDGRYRLIRNRDLEDLKEGVKFKLPSFEEFCEEFKNDEPLTEDRLRELFKKFQADEYAVEEFYEEVSTNYGAEPFESDNLTILDLMSKLRNYKDYKRKKNSNEPFVFQWF